MRVLAPSVSPSGEEKIHTPPNPRSSGRTGTRVIILRTITDMKIIEYIAPAIEVIEIEISEAIMIDSDDVKNPDMDESETHSGQNFWGD
mgnify:CR=1 FL=1